MYQSPNQSSSPDAAAAEQDVALLQSPRGPLRRDSSCGPPTEGAVKVVARFRPMNEEEEEQMRQERQPLPFTLTAKVQGGGPACVEDRQRAKVYSRFDEVFIQFCVASDALDDRIIAMPPSENGFGF